MNPSLEKLIHSSYKAVTQSLVPVISAQQTMCDYQIADVDFIDRKFSDHLKVDYDTTVTPDDVAKYEPFLREVLETAKPTMHLKAVRKVFVKNSYLMKVAKAIPHIQPAELVTLQERFRIKRGKSSSGVLVVTIFTAPYPSYTDDDGVFKQQKFSCKWNCYYCPNEPGQPRSYLKGEPGVLRANRYEFDCVRQMWGRMEQLLDIGHVVDKLEVIVLGGTWASYPHAYQAEFMRDMYYAANTFWDAQPRRERLSLDEEKRRNRDAISKIIGLTLETRPDTITPDEITRFRRYGCTRVQLGIQHLDDAILKKINRRCTYEQTVAAIAMLKDWGYKVDGHFMPNLPGATPEADERMFKTLLNHTEHDTTLNIPQDVQTHTPITRWRRFELENEDIQLDQWKIYPCEVVPFTVIEKWYKAGEFKPYEETHLTRILMDTKRKVFPWIRLNRIIRDIPSDYIMASGDHPNMRQSLQDAMRRAGYTCKCIRCREVKLRTMEGSPIYMVRQYNGSRGTEFFISCESPDESILYGFVRLRLPSHARAPALAPPALAPDHAWIRELHVYGKIQATATTVSTHDELRADATAGTQSAQHKGIGSTLMHCAECIAQSFGKHHMYVISGEGTKNYYARLGYVEEPTLGYMEKCIGLVV